MPSIARPGSWLPSPADDRVERAAAPGRWGRHGPYPRSLPPSARVDGGRTAGLKTSSSESLSRRTRSPRSMPAHLLSVVRSIARRAHRAVPAGRNTIARLRWPPSSGLRRHSCGGSTRVDHSGRGKLDDRAARSRTLSVRPGPGRIGRQLPGPQYVVWRLRQIPDHAGELARLGKDLRR